MTSTSEKSNSKHKLVVLGDSISQGFNNGGIYRTDINFPAFLARCFEPEPEFRQPSFVAQGGIPLNLEAIIRGLADDFGDTLEWNEYLPAAKYLYTTLRRIKKYWEGKITDLAREQQTRPFHNQSVWGISPNDSWLITQKKAEEYIKEHTNNHALFDMLPDHAMYTTASLVLNPSFNQKFCERSLLDNIQHLQDHGGIENLLVTLGHNNIIGAVTNLEIVHSEKDDIEKLPYERNYTVTRPEHFEYEFRKLAQKVTAIGAENIFTQTIPYATIPPVTRGINSDKTQPEGKYFDYYTRYWIWDDNFDPEKHPFLTREEVIELDNTVDAYNHSIRKIAREFGWAVVPVNKYVSGIAHRRQAGELDIPYDKDFTEAMNRNPATAHLIKDPKRPKFSTELIQVDKDTHKISQGGVFSIDGLHPSTIGYGLMADLYYKTMKKNGVNFQKPIDWDFIIENDTLLTNPPYLLVTVRKLLHFLSLGRSEKISFFSNSILHQMMEMISNYRNPTNAR